MELPYNGSMCLVESSPVENGKLRTLLGYNQSKTIGLRKEVQNAISCSETSSNNFHKSLWEAVEDSESVIFDVEQDCPRTTPYIATVIKPR